MTQNEQAIKLAQLQKAVSDAEKGLKTAKREEIMAAFDKLDAAKKALSEFEDSLITPEQVEAQKAHALALEAFNAAKTKLEEASNNLKTVYPASPVFKRSAGNNANHAPKENGYEIAQQVREAYSKGKKVVDIVKEFNISSSAVQYYVNYLQHKLKTGDTAWTPLVNKYYPLGAPMAEDNVPEGDDRYKVKTYTVKDLIAEWTADKADKKAIARKYAMTEANAESLMPKVEA